MEVGCCHSLDSCNFWSHSSRQNIEKLEKIVLEVNLKRVFTRESNWWTALFSLYPNKLCRRAVVKNDQIPRKRIEKQRWKGGRKRLALQCCYPRSNTTNIDIWTRHAAQTRRKRRCCMICSTQGSEPSFALLACIRIYRVDSLVLSLIVGKD